MKPEDKYGRPIYNHIYSQLLNIGMKLERNEFKESEMKPNLFYKYNDFGTVYADMRGTEEVPIWKEPVPLVYFYFREGVPIWKQIRFKKEELKILDSNKIPYRFSFEERFELEDGFLELFDAMIEKEREIFGDSRSVTWYLTLPDGYCKGCGKDIEDLLYHCSKKCRDKEYRRRLARTVNGSPHCAVCKKKIIQYGDKDMIKDEFGVILPDKLIGHHIRYNPENIIHVCQSCHNKIHHLKNERLKSFLPEDSRKDLKVMKSLWKGWAKLEEKEIKTSKVITKEPRKFIKCKKCGHLFAENKQKCPKCKLDKTHARTCEKCDNVFNGYGRTTCPKCRTFFR